MKSELHHKQYLLSSVNNALKVLEILMVRDSITLKELQDITGFDKTSLFKMLYTLQYRGFIQKSTNAKYRLGGRLASYGHAAASRQNLLDVAKPCILKLWGSTQQTVLLGVLGATGKVVITSIKLEKDQDTFRGRTGGEMFAHSCAMGKLLLANLNPDVQHSLLQSLDMPLQTETTITDAEMLLVQLQSLRGKQIVAASDEHQIGHSDIAAPIYDSEGTCIASLSIAFRTDTPEEQVDFYKRQLRNAAVQLSTHMGYSGYLTENGEEKPVAQ